MDEEEEHQPLISWARAGSPLINDHSATREREQPAGATTRLDVLTCVRTRRVSCLTGGRDTARDNMRSTVC